MQRKRSELVPIAEVFSDLSGPVAALRDASPQARHHFTSVVAWIGAEMEFALSQAVASGDTFEHRPSECGHCVQNFLADLDFRDLPGEAAGFELGADDTLPTADLRSIRLPRDVRRAPHTLSLLTDPNRQITPLAQALVIFCPVDHPVLRLIKLVPSHCVELMRHLSYPRC